MSFTRDLLTGLGALLAAEGHGVWSPNAVPPLSALPLITLDDLPQDPERIICITAYRAEHHGALSNAVIMIQVRIRGDRNPDTARGIADALMSAFHGRTHFNLTGVDNPVHIVQCQSRSESPLGPDGQGRHHRVINFAFDCNRAGAHVETGV